MFEKLSEYIDNELDAVTCRDIDFWRGAHTIQVPEEAHTAGCVNDHPERFESLKAEICYQAEPGTLFLVGAGLFGKIYCGIARKWDAVALDVGSLFDGWAGVFNARSYLTRDAKRYTIRGEANASADDDAA